MQQDKIKKIILVGGGSAGHVLPLLSVAQQIRKQDKNSYFYYLGSGSSLERAEVRSLKISYYKVLSGKWRRNISFSVLLRNLFDLSKVFLGLFQSFYLIAKIRPDIIFSKGGFVSVPVSLVAGLMRIPLVLHESDASLGLANSISLRFASRIATAFPVSFYAKKVRAKGFYAGVPLRQQFTINKYKVSDDYILFMGGSLGAERLNNIFYSIGEKLLKKHKVVHLTGRNGYEKAKSYKESLPSGLRPKYTPIDYTQDVAKLISSAKLVVSRAGASSIFEIAAFSKKAILIPIDAAVAPHQLYNAKVLKDTGLAELFMQDEDPEKLPLLISKVIKSNLSLGPLSFKKSSEVLAEEILDFLDKRNFLSKIKKIFLVGVNGVSMKGLKHIFEKLGKTVVGSDVKTGGHSKDNITDDLDLVVYSSAITKNSPGYIELEEAHKKKIPTAKRSQVIGKLMQATNGISVSGMHGKTTISLLLARIFEADGLLPTYLVGAPYSSDRPSYRLGQGSDFVSEACEYDDSFLDFSTRIAIISNIEREHLDYFKGGISQIKKHFIQFCRQVKPGGAIVYCADDHNTCDVIKKARGYIDHSNISLYSYGFKKGADFRVKKYRVGAGLSSFDIKFKDEALSVATHIIGRHFALNVAAVLATCIHRGVDIETALAVIADYRGAKRRMEFVARVNDASFYDDYAHHPTEISVTLKAFEEMFPNSRKILIYEPHQQKRFNDFYNDFKQSFRNSDFDIIGILPVCKIIGRDESQKKSSFNLVSDLRKFDDKYYFLKNYTQAVKFLDDNLKKNDIVVTMGATDVYRIIDNYINSKKY